MKFLIALLAFSSFMSFAQAGQNHWGAKSFQDAPSGHKTVLLYPYYFVQDDQEHYLVAARPASEAELCNTLGYKKGGQIKSTEQVCAQNLVHFTGDGTYDVQINDDCEPAIKTIECELHD